MTTISFPPTGFDDLSVDDQVDYLNGLGDHIASRSGRVPVAERHWRSHEERSEVYPDAALALEKNLSSITYPAEGQDKKCPGS
jgi:hypothetical protein